ncbi:hypothetical protein BBJ28_00020116, partial [Nothophytophthora sp. Chile5]
GSPAVAGPRKKQRIGQATRVRLPEGDEEVVLSTSVVAAGNGGDDDEDDGDDGDGENTEGNGSNHEDSQGDNSRRAGGAPAIRGPVTPVGAQSSGGGGAGDDGDGVRPPDWWALMTPEQQRALVTGQILPRVSAPVVAPRAQPKRKKLDVEDWSSTGNMSVEAWLGLVHSAIQRHAVLDGEDWTTEELYYGVSARLTGAAAEWFNDLSVRVHREDRTVEYLTDQLEKTYGSRDTDWQIQRKLGSRAQRPGERLSEFARHLREIGRGHPRVQETWYVEAFLEGINNKFAGSMTRMTQPRTLQAAVQAAVDSCGEYGEGRDVGWQAAAQLHARDRPLGGTATTTTVAAPELSSTADSRQELLEGLELSKLGLGFAGRGEEPPKFDMYGKRISGLAAATGTGRDGGLSLAALQAIAIATRIGQAANQQPPASRSMPAATKVKAARALEVKAEVPNQAVQHDTEAVQHATDQTMGQRSHGYRSDNQRNQDGGRYGGGNGGFGNNSYYHIQGGFDGRGNGRGNGGYSGGTQGQSNRGFGKYGPGNNNNGQGRGMRPFRPSNDNPCFYCKEPGHWIRDCPIRMADLQQRLYGGGIGPNSNNGGNQQSGQQSNNSQSSNPSQGNGPRT